MSNTNDYVPVFKMCHSSDCCPELLINDAAPVDRQVRITDDFGQKIEMSKGALAVLIRAANEGTIRGI